jgi:hypothetical protein
MRRCASIIFFVGLVASLATGLLFAADKAVESYLPATCGEGWVMDGAIARYTSENLYKYINGEAELYLPYGFEVLASVHYQRKQDAGAGIAADLFRMGSLLDGFGIYGNYRSTRSEKVGIGAQGFMDESELMFYKDRYFVRLSSSGQATPDRSVFLACARAIGALLPGGSESPKELDILRVPGVSPGSEKYYPQGLLGYAFFKRGMTAETDVLGVTGKVFVVFENSPEGAARALDDYISYLKEAGREAQRTTEGTRVVLSATDPLYKGVLLTQAGRHLVGVTGLVEIGSGRSLIEQVIKRLPKT